MEGESPSLIRLKKRLWHRFFPVNFANVLRARFLQKTSGWVLLNLAFSVSLLLGQNITLWVTSSQLSTVKWFYLKCGSFFDKLCFFRKKFLKKESSMTLNYQKMIDRKNIKIWKSWKSTIKAVYFLLHLYLQCNEQIFQFVPLHPKNWKWKLYKFFRHAWCKKEDFKCFMNKKT